LEEFETVVVNEEIIPGQEITPKVPTEEEYVLEEICLEYEDEAKPVV